MKQVGKAVIPVAGFGTRMLPAAKAIPKEMLPILDRPTIQYVVQEVADAKIDDLLFITSRGKRAVEDHFDRDVELEQRLAGTPRERLLGSIRELAERVHIHAVRQSEQRGLGHAVLHAKHHVGDAPFLCLLGDTIFSGGVGPASQLIEAYQRFGTSIIGLEEVSADKVDRYGIVGGTSVDDGVIRIDTLIEKPSVSSAPSRLAIAARYVLSPAIFDCLERTAPGKGGEIQLTDALAALVEIEPVHGIVLRARRHDIGNPLDWLKTNLLYAAREPELWAGLEPMLRSMLK